MAKMETNTREQLAVFEQELRKLGVTEDRIKWLVARRNPEIETDSRSLLLIDERKCPPYVYIVRCAGTDFYKVGISTGTPINRLTGLQVGCPYQLQMLHVFVDPSARVIEREIHAQLKHCRVRGEWFELKPLELQALIQEIADRIGAERPIMRRVA